MNQHVRDCLVTKYADLIPGLQLPDPDDRHVLAAAIRGRADVIVTFNLKDFPATSLAPYEIEAQHPDDFINYLFDIDSTAVCIAARNQRANLKNPPKSVPDYLERLKEQGLVETAARLEEFTEFL